MCCLSCSCAFKLQLVPLLALGLVRAPGYEQHLLLRVLVLASAAVLVAVSVQGLLLQFHAEALALPVLERGADGKLILTASRLYPRGFSTIQEKNELIFSCPIVKGRHVIHARPRELLNPTSFKNRYCGTLW